MNFSSPLSEAELKLRKKEEKMKLKQLEQKKKEQVALLIKEYHRKKDDLELEDLLVCKIKSKLYFLLA